MTDVATVLRNNGLGLVDELLRAASLEGTPVPIAATIIAGESWGRNIYGHDGGTTSVPTGGTYVKGGPVTRENYLAYRAWMRAGSGRRQGVGPAQCTSAQYQDTADALGGCWDPVANMRSGFRGMGALMKRYGTRDGARRYNGSGQQAETYATNFMNRLAVWESRLRGATAAPAPEVPDMDAHQAQQLDYIASVLPDLVRRVGRIEAAAGLTVQQLCGERATVENPWPGDTHGGGWAAADGKRRTPVNFLQDIHAAVRPTSLGQSPSSQS